MKNKSTKCTVKLRKHEERNEWYLYIESYPVYVNGCPKRIREYLNRSISTPIWNKSSVARSSKGKKSYRPRRDVNGVIMCRTDMDYAACMFADRRKNEIQHRYDNTNLYSEKDAAMAEQIERSNQDVISYIRHISHTIHVNNTDNTISCWKRVANLLDDFSNHSPIPFSTINLKFIEDFRRFVLLAPCAGGKSGTISQTTASRYFSIFKAALKQAFIDEYLVVDMSAKVKNIPVNNVRRNYLTQDELNVLASTPCEKPIVKRAALFSALTGLRHCDIQKLRWSEIQKNGDNYRLNFTQQKTKQVEYMPINEQAYLLCGEPQDPSQLVFADLTDSAWISKPLERWIRAAGITRHITFHCFRHTFATLQLANGTDIYTVSKMLGHTNVKTTQIYAKVINAKKEQAANAIHISNL